MRLAASVLVKEDTSRFPYEDRLDLVLKGTTDIPRLTVHRGSEYIISRATFPCYFIKEQSVINHCYTEIDLKIFRQYLAPALGITHRFVGTEPFCTVTAQYNLDMRFWLETPTLPAPPITLVEIERLCFRRRRYPPPGYASCWLNTISRLSRRWFPTPPCAICRAWSNAIRAARQPVKSPRISNR